ncbi:transposase [Streptomyces sp. NPDC091259]|uniref:transposase n=1 Tax=Streptomyces sp. NPDC091259 TaxID=3365976 RepID=UPI003800BD95
MREHHQRDRRPATDAGALPRRAAPRRKCCWLTVFQLPSYSPDLNPQEGIWSLVKRDIGNLAAANLGQITRAVKHKLKQVQYRPDLVDGCLAGTGLIMDG